MARRAAAGSPCDAWHGAIPGVATALTRSPEARPVTIAIARRIANRDMGEAMEEHRNLILAVALTFVILISFQYLFRPPPPPPGSAAPETAQPTGRMPAEEASAVPVPSAEPVPSPKGTATPSQPGMAPSPAAPSVAQARDTVLAQVRRVAIESARVGGSIAVQGRRIDDVVLADYHETIDPDSPKITLLSPASSAKPYYAEFGWVGLPGNDVSTPDTGTNWQVQGGKLTPTEPLILTWENGQGLRFIRTYALDDNFMFTITQRIENHGAQSVKLAPFGLIARTGTPKTLGYAMLHEGALGAFDGALFEINYKKMRKQGRVEKTSTGGWIGITDKYWLTALIPDQKRPFSGHFTHRSINGTDKYQVDFLLDLRTIDPNTATQATTRLFAGAKEVRLVDGYQKRYGIVRFDRAIDWGWLFWLTKPIFQLLDFFYGLFGNFGVAILVLTVIIKAIFFPLANKSYTAMSKMKQLQPKMTAIRETYKDDKARQQQAIMALYKKEKVNPMAGCLPVVIQIPVFFSLYKVLFVTIEMRHAPFFGWVHDLSAPDHMLVANLFGLIPWDPPSFLAIGIWPLAMGVSMFLQQKLNPQPADPLQAKMFMIMPIMFTFLLARFPVGLVIYWTWNNLLSMSQQWVIMKRMGVKT